MVENVIREQDSDLYKTIDDLFISLDKANIKRTRNIRLIPSLNERRGGKRSYAEWAHVIGIFQTLVFLSLKGKRDSKILDVGTGTGLMAIACEPFLDTKGKFVGIDVMEKNINFCRKHYVSAEYEFIHLNVNNSAYTPKQPKDKIQWPLENDSFDLTTALSVWTHFNEGDALFYFKEIARVLKPKGKAIVTFFILDETYEMSLSIRSEKEGRFHMTKQNQWIFDLPAYESDAWFYPARAKVPESAIGVTQKGLDRLLSASGLTLLEHYQGNWKEVPGVFFQDILVFEK